MESENKDHTGSKVGMWLILYTEIMLFGGLFVLYAAYLKKYPEEFVTSGKQLDLFFGTLNTVILLISSFAVAASITSIRLDKRKLALGMLWLTLLCGIIFLYNKFIEWGHKFDIGIFPGSEAMKNLNPGENIFFGLYYLITGLHGLHIVIGMALLVFSVVKIYMNKIDKDSYIILENSGLYWHLVDLIWIFIFPLFYLIV